MEAEEPQTGGYLQAEEHRTGGAGSLLPAAPGPSSSPGWPLVL